jgi:anaerobic selenocysteine-containing dehydrogenase
MTQRAEGTFQVTSWDESTYEELDGKEKLTKASMEFGYTGDLEATSKSETLMFYREDGTAAYTGLERITGRLGDRSGSFVLRADGTFENGAARTAYEVVAGSGSGELRGLRGAGSAVAASGQPGGTFTLDYDLG